MDAQTEQQLRELFFQRISEKMPEISRSLEQIAAGNPLGAEPSAKRRAQRIATISGLPSRDTSVLSGAVGRAAENIDSQAEKHGPESMKGLTLDFVGVNFLTKGRQVANAVGRVVFKTGRAQGSGFLVGPGIFLTNNHVIQNPAQAAQMVVEFDFETDANGVAVPVTTYALNADACFAFDPIDKLDFTLIALGTKLSGTKSIKSLGHLALSDAGDKHMLGEIANIIQHPEGGYKQLVVRENSLISRDETHEVLHYLADTQKGSSGSPVCNNDWEPIALHHWGEPHAEIQNRLGQPLPHDVNEGIRISAIVRALKAQIDSSDTATSRVLTQLIELWGATSRSGPVNTEATRESLAEVGRLDEVAPSGLSSIDRPRVSADGHVTWTLPIELSVRLPGYVAPPPVAPAHTPSPEPALTAINTKPISPLLDRGEMGAEKKAAETDFSDRNGYEPGFLQDHLVPLPDWSNVVGRIALNQQAMQDDDPHELRYHHFSVVMHAEKRLAVFTACNIDGRSLVAVKREDKSTIENPTIQQLGVESLGSESSDDFRRDPRILDSEQMGVEFYENQDVPGFPKPQFPGKEASPAEKSAYNRAMNNRTARMFQKGHITLRGDPAWGTPNQALLAEDDTFFYTNAAPQLGYFNQGSPAKSPGAKGTLRWRAVETYVLRNTRTMRQRVSVFAGPVFGPDDPTYRFQAMIPMRFWKIVVWKGPAALHSIALLADQGPVLAKLTKGVPESMETFQDEAELARVTEFLSTVEHIEELTGLRFPDVVRVGDVRKGQNPSSDVSNFAFRS